MNLEKKEYLPENYREVYEDEIDLKELFLVLWRNKVKIIILAFICMVLGFGAGKVAALKNKKSTVTVEYTYSGIEEGKSPNGNALGLTYNQFKNIFMIKDIFHKMPELEKEGISQDGLLNGIKITPVLPKELKNGEIYFPNKFIYSLKMTGSSERDEEVLRNFIEVQRDYFKKNYKLSAQIPRLNYNESNVYDYKDIVSVLKSSLDTAIMSADSLNLEMENVEDKVEIQSIIKELRILKDINLLKITNMIEDYSVTKNPEELMITYRQQIENLEKQKERIIGKIAQLEDMIKKYKPAEKEIVVMSNGSSEKIKTDNENYYTEFLRNLAAEKIKLSEINVEIKYVKDKMNKELNNDTTKSKDVNTQLKFITDKFNEKTEKINSLVIKNYNKKYADIIKISEDVTTKADSKALIFALAGLVLGGMLGVCYVLLKNFIFEEKKKER